MEQLPIYNAELGDMMDGIFAVSLVEYPAVESDFVCFAKDKEQVMFSVENEEEHNILGCVLRADHPIYRIGENGEEYYIRFSKETIAKMTEKMLKDYTFNNIDLEHNCADIPSGITLRQLFIKDTEKGISPVGFDDVQEGSLFALYHIDSMELWDKIKAGEFKGFSVEAWLSLVKVEMHKQDNNKSNKSFLMNIKEKLAKLLATFNMVGTDKGNLNWEGSEDLKEGDVVTKDNGDAVEDGEYKTEDGKVITVKDGVVESIKDAEAEVAPEEPTEEPKEDEKPVEGEEEKPAEEPAEEPTEEPTEEPAEEPFDAKAEIEALKKEIEDLKAKIAEIVSKPVVEPIEEEFSKTAPKADKKANKAQKYFEAMSK